MDLPSPSSGSDCTRFHRWAGIALAAGACASVGLMAIHPHPSSHELGGVVKMLADAATLNRAVHGGMILSIGIITFGLVGLSHRLGGLGGAGVLSTGGLVAQLFGWIMLSLAATINGLVITSLAESYSAVDASKLEALRPILVLCNAAHHAVTNTGMFASGLAIVLFGGAILAGGGLPKWLGVLGLLVGAAPAGLVAAGSLPMDVHGFGAVVLGQAVWYIATGVSLARGPSHTP